ncbi:MAG TPA: mevalonate kinase [Thermoleophilia bacterium]|nr:mevalonate kinase [Acidobacteriota bacterium]NLT93651.1 mevalonate kinase [Actinomycetota bacterium]HOU28555.1 mevalonate kinase [Thermoleophilia bacterium]HQH22000.1 mevalonate kinase [Thermoleophilia bacterium]
MGEGSGFGKTILIGDQFVLEEVPAIVAAIPYSTVTTVERLESGSGWTLDDRRDEVPGYKEKKREQHGRSIDTILEAMGVDVAKTPIKITMGGTLLAGSGVGASAASCVSLARALDAEFGLGYTIEQINHVAWQGEFPYHGVASGVDNTASTYGGLLFFYLKDKQQHFEQIAVSKPVDIVLANSGVTVDTASLDAFIDEQKEAQPELFAQRLERIREEGRRMKAALEADDWTAVGGIMSENHELLTEMGMSHEKLDEMCAAALDKGALGAKVTGGGRGGYMVSLTPGRELQESVASMFEARGHKVIRATIGGPAAHG